MISTATPRVPSTASLLRWGGLIAATLLGLSGYLGGRPYLHDGRWWAGVGIWFLAAPALTYIWLRLGRLIRDPTGPGVRWLLTTAAIWAVPLLLAPPLGSQDAYCYACQGQLYLHGFDLYAVGPAAMPCTWLAWVPEIWRSAPVPYGPLWIALSGAAVGVAGHSLPIAIVAFRVIAVAGTLLAVTAGAHLARRCGGRPATVVWVAALSPLVLVHDISGAHNDALLAGLILLGLAVAVGRHTSAEGVFDRPAVRVGLAGVAFGLAVAVKVTALVAAPFVVPLVLAARPGLRRLLGLNGVLAASIITTYGVLAAVTGYGLGFVQALTRTGGMVQWLSLPSGVGMTLGYLLRALGWPGAFDTAVAIPRTIAMIMLVPLLAALWWRAVRTSGNPSAVVTAAGLALIATVVLGPVVYAWYAVAGLCVLATVPLPRPGRLAVIAGAAGLIFATLPDGLGLATKTKGPGAVLDVVVLVAAAVWGWRSWRERRRGARAALTASAP